MEAKHTEGPWSIRSFANSYSIESVNDIEVAATTDPADAGVSDDEAAANANLIAAAPDLLAALVDAQALLRSHPETVTAADRQAALDSIAAVLAKARA